MMSLSRTFVNFNRGLWMYPALDRVQICIEFGQEALNLHSAFLKIPVVDPDPVGNGTLGQVGSGITGQDQPFLQENLYNFCKICSKRFDQSLISFNL
jgi:hypothetical protein